METILGILIGVIATVIVSHYYYKRGTNKSLSPFVTLSARLFSGIEPSVRKQLKFLYQNSEVEEIHQLEFLVANDGERAIANCIEPLRLQIPRTAKVLDAAIVHRHPDSLKVSADEKTENERTELVFNFPLLNKGDFFLVKLLLSGHVNWRDLQFDILADDLPRSIAPRWLPQSATRKERLKVDWAAVAFGAAALVFTLGWAYALYLLWLVKPELIPYPWSSFVPTVTSVILSLVWGIGLVLSVLVSVAFIVGIGFEEHFSRHPKFPLPDEYRHSGSNFDIDLIKEDIEMVRERLKKAAEKQEEEKPN